MHLTGCFRSKQKEGNFSDKALEISTRIIENYTTQEYDVLERKSYDPTASEGEKVWIKNAEKIKHLTTAAYASVDSCFTNYNNISSDEYKSKLTRIVTEYKSSVLQVDPELFREMSKEFSIIVDSNYSKNFDESPSRDYLKNKAHNSIAVIANQSISFCSIKTEPGCILTYDKFSAIVGQNSIHFKSGDKLEITAGVGLFSRAASPQIVIDNEKVSLNDDDCAIFRKTITGKPGEYTVPVSIDYYSPDGTKKKQTFKIKYFID
jgi:hypothetical protein